VILVDANENVEKAREQKNTELGEELRVKKNDVVQIKKYLHDHNAKANSKVGVVKPVCVVPVIVH
jgi:hypothetical protein